VGKNNGKQKGNKGASKNYHTKRGEKGLNKRELFPLIVENYLPKGKNGKIGKNMKN